jgi:hypothetical protein
LFFDDVTGIDDAVRQERLIGSAWYNLQGQKVEKPSKGVYINNQSIEEGYKFSEDLSNGDLLKLSCGKKNAVILEVYI